MCWITRRALRHRSSYLPIARYADSFVERTRVTDACERHSGTGPGWPNVGFSRATSGVTQQELESSSADGKFDRIDEPQRDFRVRLVGVVVEGSIDVGCLTECWQSLPIAQAQRECGTAVGY